MMAVATPSSEEHMAHLSLQRSILKPLIQGVLMSLAVVNLPLTLSSTSLRYIPETEVRQTVALCVGCSVTALSYFKRDILKVK